MKITQINICDNGSTGKIMLDIFSALDNTVEKKAYVSLKYTDNDIVERIHSKNGYRVHKFLSMYLGLDEWGSYFSTKKLIKKLRKEKPDILHLHNIHSYAVNYKLLFDYIKKDNIRVVWTLHDCWAFTGGCTYFDRNNCYKWQQDCSKCPHLYSAGMITKINPVKKLYKIKKQAFTGVKNMTIVTPSQWLANLAKQSFLSEYPIIVINNGVNLDNFSPIDNGTFDKIIDRKKKILLGAATPFNERKGFSDFIKLAKILPSDYQMVMVGLTDEQISLLPNNVVGLKRTNNQTELAQLYSLAYCFINLTYEDTSSTTNIEALACGAPVICYNTGGATEMLDKTNSVVLEKGQYEKVLDALKLVDNIRKNKDVYISIAKKNYCKEDMTRNYMKLYFDNIN